MDLRSFLLDMPVSDRVEFAARCKTSWPHLRNVMYGRSPCSEFLAIEIERESGGKVAVETVCPCADWAVVRGAGQAKVVS